MLVAMSRQPAKIDLQANLARNVRAVRTAVGMTQEELAESSGLHQTYVSDVERGKRNVTLDVVARLAEALRVSPLDLLGAGGE
ncbi:MAG: helix-turn-helix domain-containing protein [Solimonas sp.]